jgi:catechol 2,3-dioxygenase-like lactoylglutathione lyase family enzyme
LLDALDAQVERALNELRAMQPHTLTERRAVGRKQLPSSVMGLLFHAAEHAQRHVGQLLVTARVQQQDQTPSPAITRILETALYVDDLDAAVAFYRDVLALRVLNASERLVSMDAGQATVLLLFRRGATVSGLNFPSGWIPPHDGQGPVHLAFAIATEALEGWVRYLEERGVAIESRVRWDRGGQSIYFRDPAGHSVELATPGTWAVY